MVFLNQNSQARSKRKDTPWRKSLRPTAFVCSSLPCRSLPRQKARNRAPQILRGWMVTGTHARV